MSRAYARSRQGTTVVVGVLVSLATTGLAATSYDGPATLAGGIGGTATATVSVTVPAVEGTIVLAFPASPASGPYAVRGRWRRTRVNLTGTAVSGARLRWKARVHDTALSGPFKVRMPGQRVRGTLDLSVRPADASLCDIYFRDEVLARVLVPVCADCHRPGRAAAGTRLAVDATVPDVTRRAVATLIDPAAPSTSLLLEKPLGGRSHGGGAVLAVGSAEQQILTHWTDLVSTGGCGSEPPPGGGGGSDPGTALFVDKCASCHGVDGRGGAGRPSIRCNRDVSDAVRSGRPGATPATTMPPFPLLTDADLALLQGHLDGLCPTATATGADLWSDNCASCHGLDATGASGPAVQCARTIRDVVLDGVAGPLGHMPMFWRLPDTEIQRIQDHLLGRCPVGSPSGAELFAANCASCHGVAGQGYGRRPDIRCTAASRVAHAVRRGRGLTAIVMPTFPPATLPDGELAAITALLAPSCSQTGAALFASNCATCHGATGTGGTNADGIAGPGIRCATSTQVFDAVIDGYGGMPAIADLTTPQVNAIVGFVRTGCP